jgi:hypothetical protein
MAVQSLALQASATQTATGNGAWFAANTATMLSLLADITAGVAITDFDLWLEGTNDKSQAAGYPIQADQVCGPGRTASTNNRIEVVLNKSTTTAEKFSALFKHLPWAFVRVAWALTGTSVTFSATATVK